MMCGEVRELLFAFLDNELDAPLSIELQRHLDACADCAREGEIERTIRQRLEGVMRKAMHAVPDVDSFASRLTLLDDKPQDTPSWKSRTTPNRVRLKFALAAALFGAVTLSAWSLKGILDKGPQLADLLVADLEHFIEEGSVVEVSSSDPKTVTAWLRAKTALAVALPEIPQAVGTLMGGRKCTIDGNPAAFAIYDVNGQPVSFVVWKPNNASVERMQRFNMDGASYLFESRRGFSVIAHTRGDLIYAAVSPLSKEATLKFVSSVPNESH